MFTVVVEKNDIKTSKTFFKAFLKLNNATEAGPAFIVGSMMMDMKLVTVGDLVLEMIGRN